jgi:hypothetical protein
MKTRTLTLLTALLLAPLAALHAADESAPDVIRVACVGDSITQGVHVRGEDNYPSVLGRLLGARYEVRNFGYLGGTVMNTNRRKESSAGAIFLVNGCQDWQGSGVLIDGSAYRMPGI